MPERNNKAKLIDLICETCDKSFQRRAWRERKAHTFCSVKCSPKTHKPRPVEPRFWPQVEKSKGCWLWTGAATQGGYGTISVNNIRTRAHRLSWELHNGPIPNGLCVLHHCDNPPCVNPDHLFLGTKKDNSVDMMRKGRGALQRMWNARRACRS